MSHHRHNFSSQLQLKLNESAQILFYSHLFSYFSKASRLLHRRHTLMYCSNTWSAFRLVGFHTGALDGVLSLQ